MTLSTGLSHISSSEELTSIINENENVMVCCGRMGPMCVPVYEIMEGLEGEYANVKFYDMAFDIPEAHIIKKLPECSSFTGLPFTVYYKNGKVAKATSSIQTIDQVTEVLDKELNS